MRPTSLLIFVVVAVSATGFSGTLESFWPVTAAILGAAVVIDVWLAQRSAQLSIRREIRTNLALDREATVRLYVSHSYDHGVHVALMDRVPNSLNATGSDTELHIPPGRTAVVEYSIRPERRGDVVVEATDVLIRSPIRLWELRRQIVNPSQLRVIPDLRKITRHLELASSQHATRHGVKMRRRRGTGLEFHQLREYIEGDSLSQIHWNSTAKWRRLISREYHDESNQHILFLLDSGRAMRSIDGETSHFDQVLEAVLLLSYIALRQGDVVSVLCFGHSNAWVPPFTGSQAMGYLMNQLYDLQSGPVPSDYVSAAEEVMRRQRRRSLVVLVTNYRSEDRDLPTSLRLLSRRHLVLLANLREPLLDAAETQDIVDFEDALTVVGAIDFANARKLSLRQCLRESSVVIDSLPRELPTAVVNTYWRIKRSGLL